jgi:cytochrome c oxidase assembly protein subunit 15
VSEAPSAAGSELAESGTPAAAARPPAPAVVRWLWVIWFAILVMVAIGGITRLTGSGLSLVEWRPITGAIPPLDDAAWDELFAEYRRSPEFRHANHWMSLADFKRIFFWEYLHRLWGRLIGAAVLLPWLHFMARRMLPSPLAWKTLGLLGLGALQGALGWYMVQSGLVDEPRVSHYRLAAHLLLAFATGAVVLWLALESRAPRGSAAPGRAGSPAPGRHASLAWAMIALLLLQTLYGAFMAGTRAGYYYATFPDMDGRYLPGPFFAGASWLADALASPPAIHWLHRFLGWLTLCYAIGLWAFLRRVEPRAEVKRAAALLAAAAFVQFNLGALTVLSRVAPALAVAHQVVAYLMLSSAVLLLFRARGETIRRDLVS